MSQVTALSVLASVYLQSVVAAGGDDAESFLSPLASRSKVREVIRGLTATRQLSLIQMETHSLLYVEGSLPEFPEAEKPAPSESDATAKPVVRRPHPTSPQGMEASLRRSVAGPAPRPAYKRPAAADSEGFEKGATRPPQRAGGGSFRPTAGVRPPSRKREGGYRPAAGSTRPFKPRTSPVERPAPRSEPGTGLRPDGTPKKTRWRDLPGGRPDQKGRPKRFGPRKPDGASEGASPRPERTREPGSFRPSAGARPSGARPSGARPSGLRPPFDRRPTGGDRRPTGSDRVDPPDHHSDLREVVRLAAVRGLPLVPELRVLAAPPLVIVRFSGHVAKTALRRGPRGRARRREIANLRRDPRSRGDSPLPTSHRRIASVFASPR